ncbi:WYL domain-containing protein [Streptomyces sp. ISL-22]|uniref:helix-turn-helix transcriptional regulator n=1 Tax=unclassified Streptomyces TaxID=2593676 RepID=UPI001BE5311F|nr:MULTISPECIES: WYL domain-containing protein [unclassified Streptomyces]MBT2421448.1 WYL domain-containing protein [Streptomyces sp. ISL-24]MBT2435601.1 WYL domain-containing protein [Streptomyces sp. ISL-22]
MSHAESHADSPTARALLLLELLQSNPGITADRLADRLGVSERAARRYVGILREAGIPVESTRGPYGGYRIGRGLRLPPLMFSPTEALGLVMAVLDGHHDAADPSGPVGSALGKLLRALPEPVAHPAEAVRRVSARGGPGSTARPHPGTTAALVQAAAAHRRLRLGYRLGTRGERTMEVDPWAVVVHHGRWYLHCWSHTREARRVLRVDRVAAVTKLPDTFEPPAGLNPAETVEEHLSEGWTYEVEIVIHAPAPLVAEWLPRSLGRPEPVDDRTTRLLATTDEPDWYAAQLTAIRAPFRIVGPRELREAAGALGRRLADAAAGAVTEAVDPGKTVDHDKSFD